MKYFFYFIHLLVAVWGVNIIATEGFSSGGEILLLMAAIGIFSMQFAKRSKQSKQNLGKINN
jgi:hypothetical protein